MAGTLDDGPDALPPKGEFFTRYRNEWMPQIPGKMDFLSGNDVVVLTKGSGTFQKEQLR